MMPLDSELLSKYFLRKGKEFVNFWTTYQQLNRKTLYILGLGFDPRTLSCFEIICQNKGNSTIDCMVIEYDDNFDSREPMTSSLKSNIESLEGFIPRNKWKIKSIKMQSTRDYTMSFDVVNQLKKSDFFDYSDIIIDISAMPNAVYFPLVKTVLDWIDSKEINGEENAINLHIVVAENAKFDGKIITVGMNDTVTYMYKFSKYLESQANESLRKIWLPLLGENQINQLDKIDQEIDPSEVCPILPSPSIDPYRTKKLLLNYRELLFDTLDLNERDFIYSNEQNPFETFRRIYETSKYYYSSFRELQGCSIVISPLSSKLLCLGAFLAAYVLYNENSRIGVAHIENQTYSIDLPVDFDEVKRNSVPFTIWLTGDVYE